MRDFIWCGNSTAKLYSRPALQCPDILSDSIPIQATQRDTKELGPIPICEIFHKLIELREVLFLESEAHSDGVHRGHSFRLLRHNSIRASVCHARSSAAQEAIGAP
ncbi:hypothetical protein [Cryobacterium sp. GrIS_2_6]|uniref:hypothetical protein n=1 Tax=Cryobacterium sp. GrIS_2_6 TaxID=3162785 RepID=UPI002DF8C8D0|nr:hypothetical protein [Cryobacterium psychrotolerans]